MADFPRDYLRASIEFSRMPSGGDIHHAGCARQGRILETLEIDGQRLFKLGSSFLTPHFGSIFPSSTATLGVPNKSRDSPEGWSGQGSDRDARVAPCEYQKSSENGSGCRARKKRWEICWARLRTSQQLDEFLISRGVDALDRSNCTNTTGARYPDG